MKLKLLSVIALLLCTISCRNEYKGEIGTIAVEMETNTDVGEFLKSVEMVQLETNEECLLGNIKNICIDENFYYLTDELNRSIFIFTKSGGYVSKISQYGSGPNEYVELSDFDVKNGLIYVLSNPNKKILIFNKTGKCLKTIGLNDWYHHLAVGEDLIMLHSSKSNEQHYNIVSIDYNGNMLDRYLPFEKNNNFRYVESPFKTRNKKNFLLTFPYDGRVVNLSDRVCTYKYKIDFEAEVKFSDEELDELTFDEIRNQSMYRSCFKRINSIVELDGNTLYMIVSAYYNGEGERQALCKVNMKDGTSKFYKLGEKIETEYPYLSNLLTISNDHIYSFITPYLKNAIDINMGNDSYDKVNEDENPILCIYTINK